MARTSPATHIEGMTNHMTTQRPEHRPAPGGLTRIQDGAILGGVAGGLARRLDVSPSWIRLGFIVTAFFGGLGALLYLVGWLAIPEEGADQSVAEDFLSSRSGSSAWLGIGLIVVAACRAHRRRRPLQLPARLRRRTVPGRFPALPGAGGEGMHRPPVGRSPPDGETPPPTPTATMSAGPPEPAIPG